MNVRDAVSNVLAYFANALGSAVIDDFTMRTSQLFLQGRLCADLCVRALVRVRWH
jgi:hypothetical protein